MQARERTDAVDVRRVLQVVAVAKTRGYDERGSRDERGHLALLFCREDRVVGACADEHGDAQIGEEFATTGKERRSPVGAGTGRLCRARDIVDFAEEWMAQKLG